MSDKIIDKKTITWLSKISKQEFSLDVALISHRIGDYDYPTIVFYIQNKETQHKAYTLSYQTDIRSKAMELIYTNLPDYVVALINFSNDLTVGLDATTKKEIDEAIDFLKSNKIWAEHAEEMADAKNKAQNMRQKSKVYNDIVNEGGEGYNPYDNNSEKFSAEPYQKSDFQGE